LAQQILADKDHLSVALDVPDRLGIVQFQHALGQLATHGVPIRLDRLYEGRGVRQHDLKALLEETRKPSLPATTWMVDGAHARPLGSSKSVSKDTASSHNTGVLRSEPEPVEHQRSEASSVVSGVERAGGTISADTLTATRSEDGEVVLRFQQMMNRFLEVQQQVMLAYLSGDGGGQGSVSAEIAKLVKSSTEWSEKPLLSSKEEGVVMSRASSDDGSAESALGNEAVGGTGLSEKVESDQLKSNILNMISDCTGYPVEMLDLDLQLEGDLGIDSIKRVEIMSSISKKYFAGRQEVSEEVTEELNALKTLRSIIEWIQKTLAKE
jgi:acyl carrier protein